MQYFPDFFDFSGMTRTGLGRAIGNAVPARAGYVVALPLLIVALETETKGLPEVKSQSQANNGIIGIQVAEMSGVQ